MQFCKSCISGMGGSIDIETKGIRVMTLSLDFQGQISKKLYPWSGVADCHGTKGMSVGPTL